MKGKVREFGCAIGVDLSATNTTVILGNSKGEVFAKRKGETDISHLNAPSMQVMTMASECMADHRVRLVDIDGIGVSCVGPYDKERGGILRTANIPFDFVPIREPLKRFFGGKPRFVRGGDCFGAVHAEADFGLDKGLYGPDRHSDNIVYITISTGIGGGVIVDGKALVGKDGDAGHIGHFTIDASPNARECGCRDAQDRRRKGHWEAYCSGTAVANWLRGIMYRVYEHYYNSPFLDSKVSVRPEDRQDIWWATQNRLRMPAGRLDDLKAEDLYEVVRKRDSSSSKGFVWKTLLEDINRYNTLGFAAVTDAYNPDIIIVGGSMMNDEDMILPYVREHLHEHAILPPPEVIKTKLGPLNVALGGLAMLRHYDGE